jgi:hypothetical protein
MRQSPSEGHDAFCVMAIIENEGDKSSHLRHGMENVRAGRLPEYQTACMAVNRTDVK